MLSLIVIAAIIGLLLFWSVPLFVADMRLRTSVSEELVGIMTANDSVTAALGAPIRRAGSATGCVNRMDDGVRTLVALPVSGPNGRGVLYVDGLRKEDGWSFAAVTLHVDRRTVYVEPGAFRIAGVAANRFQPPPRMQPRLQTAAARTTGRRSIW
jgi:hypothetical protein